MPRVPSEPSDDVDSARWERIDRIFAVALERPPELRQACLDEECGDDLDLRREVESLLAGDHDDGFLAVPAADEAARLLAAPVPASAGASFTPGQVLGNRFRIHGELGRGGMGQVWHALDLKLRVDVALKAVRPELLASPRAAEALRQEVRAARQVVSPNVCRVFDLVEADGRELLSMEYVDGATLARLFAARAPLPLDEAQDIAAQVLSGLQAIHATGLVHRDVKPENLMITPAGRVVVMDFGIARAAAADAQVVAGTPSYMAPEQVRGEPLDGRADVYSAGVVLADMVAPAAGGARRRAADGGIDLSDLGDAPWAPVLRRAVAPHREDRFATALAFARALEEVTRRTTGAEDVQPYPGLAAFSSGDAEYFFGRELEIEELWRQLHRRHLLALIGPSGAGKSSFLRAGLVPATPPGWRVVLTSPGERPFAALARALARELAGDPEAVARLVDAEQTAVALELAARWRRRHEHALVVVDHFEELFTQGPPEAQERFADLLSRLALEADVRVLLALRDDFLLHCHRHAALAPIFSALTPIGPPRGDALRRALVQPALMCGYHFEDEALVDTMLAEVAGERGALPLVAFTMQRLWERRDRERGLLTRAAYERIGGVAGSLAQHAEATLERIGRQRTPVVREIFRNLVTAQGTRTAVARDELLSVFGATPSAAGGGTPARPQEAVAVLDELVDGRLLTSYELSPADGDDAQQRVELIHESLLSSWPRLVRWQSQDEQGALLRDQLRQAARLWEERGRPDDLLWTGTSLREYQLWRESYSGGLSAPEERFAAAMTARDRRRRQRRRAAVAAVVIAALVTASAMGVLWQRSERARAEAVDAAQQAAAEQLFTRGQLELERNPTAAVAYALASLERRDTAHARLLTLRALWRGPTAFELVREETSRVPGAFTFSPDGRWLLSADGETSSPSGVVRLWQDDGSPARAVPGPVGLESFAAYDFSGDSQFLVVTDGGAASLHRLARPQPPKRIGEGIRWGVVRDARLITADPTDAAPGARQRWLLRTWRMPHGELAASAVWAPATSALFRVDPAGESLLNAVGPELEEWPLGRLAAGPRSVLRHERPILTFLASPDGERIYTLDGEGDARAWSRATGAPLPAPRMEVPHNTGAGAFVISPDGRSLARANGNDERTYVWDLAGAVAAEPLVLRRGARMPGAAFHPGGKWLAVREDRAVTLWPLGRRYAQVLRGPGAALTSVAIDPAGEWVAAGLSFPHHEIWVWPTSAAAGRPRTAIDCGATAWNLAASPDGTRLAAGTHAGVWLVPLAGGPAEKLPGFGGMARALAFDAGGRRLAAGGGLRGPVADPGEAVVRVWDLDSGEVLVLDAGDDGGIYFLQFLPDGRLLSSGAAGVRLWDVAKASSELILQDVAFVTASPDGHQLLGIADQVRPGGMVGEAFVYDLRARRRRGLAHGDEVTFVAWDAAGRRVITGSRDGTVRVGPPNGEEPHLLLGHERPIRGLQVEAGGRWLASASEDGAIRLWPLPEGTPLHGLRGDELLARLRSLTNYRVREDPASPGGYRMDAEPFGGWRDPPPHW